MATTIYGEKTFKEEILHPRRKKTPSFSSSLLDAIFLSIDEPHHNKKEKSQGRGCGNESFLLRRRKRDGVEVKEEIASLGQEIKVEKWMESAASRSTPKLHISDSSLPKKGMVCQFESTAKHDQGKLFMRTKSKALKIYGDLKKVRQPISPGGKFTTFLNSFLFNSTNLKKNKGMEELSISGIKSTSLCTGYQISRPCLNIPAPSSTNKSKKSVTFCPVSVIIDEHCQPCFHGQDYDSILRPIPKITSQNIKKKNDSFRDNFRGFSEQDSNDDDDGDSCTSSDLFELDNIGILGIDSSREELPVYGTTNLKMNQAVANVMVV